MLLVVCFVALPKVYFHQLFNHTHIIGDSGSAKGEGTEVRDDKNTQGCELEKFETPVYFTIFKFILNCNPFKSSDKVSDNYNEKNPSAKKVIFSQLRAPPRV